MDQIPSDGSSRANIPLAPSFLDFRRRFGFSSEGQSSSLPVGKHEWCQLLAVGVSILLLLSWRPQIHLQ